MESCTERVVSARIPKEKAQRGKEIAPCRGTVLRIIEMTTGQMEAVAEPIMLQRYVLHDDQSSVQRRVVLSLPAPSVEERKREMGQHLMALGQGPVQAMPDDGDNMAAELGKM